MYTGSAGWQRIAAGAQTVLFRAPCHCLTHCCAAQVRDDFGKEVGSQLCHIVGADGGIVPRPVPLPSYGLMTDVAYRW